MPKISIYVPDDLHARMADLRANWSAIAQEAFVTHIMNARLQRERDADALSVLVDLHGGDYQ